MRILLPPSEAKSYPQRGGRLDLATLSFQPLTEARRDLIDRLVRLCNGPDAYLALKFPAGLAGHVERNCGLWTAPTTAARDLYNGVLYEALGLGGLSSTDKRRATNRIIVISALFGALRLNDHVPGYRLSISSGVSQLLNGSGQRSLAGYWRSQLPEVLDPIIKSHLIVDLRSSSYQSAWKPPRSPHGWAQISVVRDRDGEQLAVSHMAKHTRGLVGAYLVKRADEPGNVAELADLLAERFVVHVGSNNGSGPTRINIGEIPISRADA